MMSKMKRDLIRKMKSIKDDKELIRFLEVYVKLLKNNNNDIESTSIGSGISNMFMGCASLTSVNFSSLTSIPIGGSGGSGSVTIGKNP